MKEKIVDIHVRVSENEKKKLQRNAKKSCLSLSSYLRKIGLKQEIYSVPDKEFYKIYLDICKIKDNIYKIEKETIIKCLDVVEKKFLELYNSKNKGGDDIGNN